MNLLYISEDYVASKVHHQLLARFAERGIDATVFTVERKRNTQCDIRNIYSSVNYSVSSFSLAKISEYPYKFIFSYKRHLKYNRLLKEVDVKKVDFVHAATVFSEGAIAYMLYKNFGIPYSVAVRGTDINLYLSKMPHLWHLGRKILKHATKIVFISPAIKQNFFDKAAIKPISGEISGKCVVISNGIEDFWIENARKRSVVENPSQIIYIGRFDANKNVESLVKAVIKLKSEFPDIHLNLVGGGNECHDAILAYCEKYPHTVSYHGKIYDKDKLLGLMRSNHIFAMVSHSETFGLVYLEALSQGLPVLYSKGQGIDQSVPDQVGEKADSFDQNDITQKLRQILLNYNSYEQIDVSSFSWDAVASSYIDLSNAGVR